MPTERREKKKYMDKPNTTINQNNMKVKLPVNKILFIKKNGKPSTAPQINNLLAGQKNQD